MLCRPLAQDRDGLAFQILDRMNAVADEHFEATDMDTAEQRDRHSHVERYDERRGKVHREVDVTGAHNLRAGNTAALHCGTYVLDLREALGAQEFPGHVLGRNADARDLAQPQPSRLRWWLVSRPRRRTPSRRGGDEPSQGFASRSAHERPCSLAEPA